MSQERRTDARIPVELWVHERKPDRAVLHPAANLSPGGLFLYSDNLSPGAFLDLEFSLPGSEQLIRVRARVAWLAQGELGRGGGVEFQDLSEPDRSAIIDWTRQYD